MDQKVLALCMQRQHLTVPADAAAYDTLYRDLQPGMNAYWHGFGQPPELTFRADFDDIEYNRQRQAPVPEFPPVRQPPHGIDPSAALIVIEIKDCDRQHKTHCRAVRFTEHGEGKVFADGASHDEAS